MVSSKLRAPTEAAGVHVYRGHGFGGLDNQVAAEVEVDARLQGAADFLFDVVGFKQRAFTFEQLYLAQCAVDVLLGETGHAAVVFG